MPSVDFPDVPIPSCPSPLKDSDIIWPLSLSSHCHLHNSNNNTDKRLEVKEDIHKKASQLFYLQKVTRCKMPNTSSWANQGQLPVEAPLLDFRDPASPAYRSSEGERRWDGKNFQKILKLLIIFLRPATGSQHDFNHILPSLGWESSAAPVSRLGWHNLSAGSQWQQWQ